MSKLLNAGLSISDDLSHLVVLEHNESKAELIYLEEFTNSGHDNSELWYLKSLFSVENPILGKIDSVSLALDKKDLLIHTFPMDISLKQDQQNEHLNWELSQLIPNFHAQDYISDTHVLQSIPEANKKNILSVTILKKLVYEITQSISKNKFKLNIIDSAHFSAEKTLIQNHPEVHNQNCILLGISKNQFEISRYFNSNLIEYVYRRETQIEYIIRYLRLFISDAKIDHIYVYGTNANEEILNHLKNNFPSLVQLINPFKIINISHNVQNFHKYLFAIHKFVPAVGIALRKS